MWVKKFDLRQDICHSRDIRPNMLESRNLTHAKIFIIMETLGKCAQGVWVEKSDPCQDICYGEDIGKTYPRHVSQKIQHTLRQIYHNRSTDLIYLRYPNWKNLTHETRPWMLLCRRDWKACLKHLGKRSETCLLGGITYRKYIGD